MKKIKLMLVPFIAIGIQGCQKEKSVAHRNVFIRTSADSTYRPYGSYHTHVFYPVFFRSGGHYYHGGYDSPTARSYFSTSAVGSAVSARGSSFHNSPHSTAVVSRGGFGRSGFHSSGS